MLTRLLQSSAAARSSRSAIHAHRHITTKSLPARNNTRNFAIIESTLREGEQFCNAFFDRSQKIDIARLLNDFGVEYIELTSPAASPESAADCKAIANLGLKTKVLTHVRCHLGDAMKAIECGVDGLDIVFGTSSELRQFSHGQSIKKIIDTAVEVISKVKEYKSAKGLPLEIRFSSEDSFRSELVDLLNIYSVAEKCGVHRVGVADTVGVASPRQVHDLVKILRSVVNCDIEFHGHNDTGCAIANSFAALEAGATHIDTSILGIGERNGITPLGGFVARMYVVDKDYVKGKYNLGMLREIDNYVAKAVDVTVPFNNYVTGLSAFVHKAGIHAKAMLNNPSTYECLDPSDFNLNRYIDVTSRLTGWNSLLHRAKQRNLNLSEDQVKEITAYVKTLGDFRKVHIEEVDQLLTQMASSPDEFRQNAERILAVSKAEKKFTA